MAGPTSVLLVDGRGRVTRANAAARRALAASPGRSCADVVDVHPLGDGQGCHAGCVEALTRCGGARDVTGHCGDVIHRVACHAVGDVVVVTAEPLAVAEHDAAPSPRELEVLAHVAAGRTNKEIATCLGVSFATVRTHLEHVRAKLGAATRAEAVVRAERAGLLSRVPSRG